MTCEAIMILVYSMTALHCTVVCRCIAVQARSKTKLIPGALLKCAKNLLHITAFNLI